MKAKKKKDKKWYSPEAAKLYDLFEKKKQKELIKYHQSGGLLKTINNG